MNPEPADLSLVNVPALPEDPSSTTTRSLLSSDTNFITLTYRWQPMGYRIVINLPFIADDINPLFAIRVSPYIPPLIQFTGAGAVVNGPAYWSPIYPSPSTLSSTSLAVTCTRYDAPPTLAVVAAAHRFWRGSMKYRLRCVSNFAAQGYVIVTTAKGLVAAEVNSNTNTLKTQHRPIQGVDVGAKRWMHNGYLMSDISFFRHNEVTVPYEYPVPFYDNYRSLQECQFANTIVTYEVACPDNFILVYNRGGITGSTDGAQVVYELEYCPGDDMQFFTEIGFSRQFLEVNNFNISNNLTEAINTLDLPYTYPAYTTE